MKLARFGAQLAKLRAGPKGQKNDCATDLITPIEKFKIKQFIFDCLRPLRLKTGATQYHIKLVTAYLSKQKNDATCAVTAIQPILTNQT